MLREAAKISFCRFLILHRKCSWPFSAFSYKKNRLKFKRFLVIYLNAYLYTKGSLTTFAGMFLFLI